MAKFWLVSVPLLPSTNRPTAQALLAEDAATAVRLLVSPWLGPRTWAHFFPFQCKIKEVSVAPVSYPPTAQVLLAPVVAAPSRNAPIPRLGLGCWVHAFPFQARISGLSVVPLS